MVDAEAEVQIQQAYGADESTTPTFRVRPPDPLKDASNNWKL